MPSFSSATRTRILPADVSRLLNPDRRSSSAAPEKSPGAVLDYIATYIGEHSNIWGKQQSSTQIELIGPMQSKKGTFSDAGSMLGFRNHTVFTDLQIDGADLQRVLREMREGPKTEPRT